MDWVAMIVTLAGVTLITDHIRVGWLVALAGSLLWAVYAIQIDSGGLFWLNVAFVSVNLWGWTRWGRVRG